MIALLMVCVLLGSLLAGCGTKNDGGSSTEFKELVVGILPFTGSVPASYADEQKWFEEAGLKVKFEVFPTGAPMNEAFASKRLDVAIIGLAGVFAMANGNATTILDTNKASGGNGIYVRADSDIAKAKGNVKDNTEIYGSAESIKGKTFLGQLGTTSQLMVNAYLEKFGLTERDINFVNIDTGLDYQAFVGGQGDAASIMVPFSFQAEKEGYVRVTLDEQVIPYMSPDVMLAQNDVVKERRDELVLFVREYLRAADALEADDQLRFDFSKSYFKSAGREYTDEAIHQDIEIRKLITKQYITSNPNYKFGEGMYRIGEFFTESGKILPENVPNILKSLDTSIIKDAIGLDVNVYKE